MSADFPTLTSDVVAKRIRDAREYRAKQSAVFKRALIRRLQELGDTQFPRPTNGTERKNTEDARNESEMPEAVTGDANLAGAEADGAAGEPPTAKSRGTAHETKTAPAN